MQNNKKLVVQITGAPSILTRETSKDIMDIKVPADRPDIITEYLTVKLCMKKDEYTSGFEYEDIYDVIKSVELDRYINKESKYSYSSDIKDLLYHKIVLMMHYYDIEITDSKALYDLLTI